MTKDQVESIEERTSETAPPGTLRDRKRIAAIFRENFRYTRFPITVLYRKNGEKENYYLYCAQGKSLKAVLRNRLKRILRESVRLYWRKGSLKGFDICFLVHPDFLQINAADRERFFQDLYRDLSQRIQK